MLTVSLDRHQAAVRRMIAPHRKVTGAMGRRTGKTYFDTTIIHEKALSLPGLRIGLLMPSLKQARAVFWHPYLFPHFEGPLRPFISHIDRGMLQVTYANGSRLTTWGFENAQSIRGQGFDFVVEDECDDIDPGVEASVLRPTMMDQSSLGMFLRTGTPKRGRHGILFKNFMNGLAGTAERAALGDDAADYFSYRCTSAESRHVNQEELAKEKRELERAGRGEVYRREYEVNFDSAEGLVYSNFDRSVHVLSKEWWDRKWSEILVGVDYGTRDPGVYLVAGVLGSGRDAIIHVLEEVYFPEKENGWWNRKAAEVAARYSSYRQRWYSDPSRPDRILDIRRAVREGVPELAERFSIEEGKNEIDAGVAAVADRFSVDDPEGEGASRPRSRLYIDPSCVNLIRELGLYRRKRDSKNEDVVLDDIVDKDNHAADSLRYLIFSRFGGPDKLRHEIR